MFERLLWEDSFAREKPLYLQVKMHQTTSQEPKANDIQRNKLYFAGTQLNLKTMVLLFPMPGLQRMILFLVEKVVTTSGFCLSSSQEEVQIALSWSNIKRMEDGLMLYACPVRWG